MKSQSEAKNSSIERNVIFISDREYLVHTILFAINEKSAEVSKFCV